MSSEDLATVLADHAAWLADVTQKKVALKDSDARRANLCEANLSYTNLQKVDLSDANLQGAFLSGANLQGAFLSGANLQEAILNEANLRDANLQTVNKHITNLQEADLSDANLQEAFLSGTNLQGAFLPSTSLQGASLTCADLQGADLTRTNLQKAVLHHAELQEAVLDYADLRWTVLRNAKLQKARLRGVNLKEADLTRANLQGVFYHPQPDALPNIPSVARANGLEEITFKFPFAAVELREAFKKAGLREQQRKLTRAINYRLTRQAKEEKSTSGRIEAALKWVMFEKTCEYGWYPGRPLLLLGGFLVLFSFPYCRALTTSSSAGIWVVWLPDRVHKNDGREEPVRVTSKFFFSRYTGTRWETPTRWLRLWWAALYFSLLSAFHFGWRELNVGTWLSRLQPREYVLRATGWVRVVAGIQSLVSLYLLALWALTYFGNPFE